MEDIVPGLLKKIQNDFQKKYNKDNEIAELAERLKAGTAKHKDAYAYAGRVGSILADTYADNLSGSVLPEGKMWYNIGNRIITPTVEENYKFISDYVSEVQKQLNEAAGIGIKPIVLPMNEDRIRGIINRLASEADFDKVAWILKEPMKTLARSIVDDSIKANANFHGQSGMQPKIIRKSSGKCCKWCNEIAGVYHYPNVRKDIYRRHENCDCVVEYDPGNGKLQNVHTKQWRDADENDRMEIRKLLGLEVNSLTAQERNVRANWKLSAMSGGSISETIREELGEIPLERVEETLKYFNEQIRNLSIEHAIVIDSSGKVIHFIGEKDGVGIFDVNLEGAYITHNHPASNGIVSFGADDFYFLQQTPNIKGFCCCNESFTYQIKIKKSLDDVSYHDLYRSAMEQHQMGEDIQDEVMKILAERGYIDYDKSRVTG